MDNLLFNQSYDIKDLEKYNCKTIEQLQNKIVSELRKQYNKEIITISENNDVLVVKVENRIF